jgi:hypothetical protein
MPSTTAEATSANPTILRLPGSVLIPAACLQSSTDFTDYSDFFARDSLPVGWPCSVRLQPDPTSNSISR